MARYHFLMAGILISGLFQAVPAVASDPFAAALLPPEAMLREPAAEPAPPFATAAVVDETQLATVTGMADIKTLQQAVNVQNTSTVSDNTINGNSTTGTISIDGASFGGFNGLALVNANTGNNVSINASMNVNVAIQQ